MKKYFVKNNEILQIVVLKTIGEAVNYPSEEGWKDEKIPVYEPSIQKLGSAYYNPELDAVTYGIENISQSEINERKRQELEYLDNSFDEQAAKRLLRKIVEPVLQDEQNLNQQDIEDAKMLYKQFRVGVTYDKDSSDIDEKRFVWKGDLYKVIGAKHTSQADWTPDTAVSLYVKLRPKGEILPWVQPLSTNPYKKGEKVTHNGFTWESTVNDNPDGTGAKVWEPGVYGWIKI